MTSVTRRVVLVGLISATGSGCVILHREIEIRERDRAQAAVVSGPAKAHLIDGSVVVYTAGVTVTGDSLIGAGQRYDLQLAHRGVVNAIAIDSVLGFASFSERIKPAESVLLTAVASAAGALGLSLAAVAIFGSCPTFYTDSAGVRRLEAEGFSYSIAPLFETRDVDPLRGAAHNGVFKLEVLNEALETHYINQLELISFPHRAGQRLLPDQALEPVLTGSGVQPLSAVDQSNRNVLPELRDRDARVFSSAPVRLSRATETDLHDAIELTFPAQPGDSAALLLHLRNSLLSTVLLYDVMLADAGPHAVDWIGKRLDEVGPAAELGKWYATTMGLRVDVWQDNRWSEVARIGDSGPIAWKQLAIALPIEPKAPVRVRLRFPIDAWRIDRVELASFERPIRVDTLHVARARQARSEPSDDIRTVLLDVDERYLITEPGQRVDVEFDVPQTPTGLQRSFMLASHGYYIEWLRRDWLRRPAGPAFQPGNAALLRALQRWNQRKSVFEKQFYSTAIKVN